MNWPWGVVRTNERNNSLPHLRKALVRPNFSGLFPFLDILDWYSSNIHGSAPSDCRPSVASLHLQVGCPYITVALYLYRKHRAPSAPNNLTRFNPSPLSPPSKKECIYDLSFSSIEMTKGGEGCYTRWRGVWNVGKKRGCLCLTRCRLYINYDLQFGWMKYELVWIWRVRV